MPPTSSHRSRSRASARATRPHPAGAAGPIRRRPAGLVAALAFLALPPTAAAQPAPMQGLADYIQAEMATWRIPGMAIAVVKDGRTVWSRGFGVREVGGGGAVDENTLFAIGSSSKAFTSAAVAALVGEGELSWNDRATEHLPGFRTSDPYVTRELTVRDLLSHRSGLNRGDQVWYAMDFGREEILERVRHQPPTTSFRSTFGYNNNMYLAAGQVVQEVSGRSWDDFLDERFFTPLGMTRTVTTVRGLDAVPNVATPHEILEDAVTPVAWRNIDNIAPAGSIVSSVAEMDEWLKLQLGEGAVDGRSLVDAGALAETWTPHTVIRLQPPWSMMAPGANLMTYGMGWFVHDYRGRKVVQHGGNIDGMHALVGMMPQEELGVVILTNLNGHGLTYALLHRVFDLYLGAPEGGLKDWSAELKTTMDGMAAQARAAAAEFEASRIAGTTPSLPLDGYAGTYRHPMYGDLVLTLEDGGLVARRNGAWVGDLEHWHHDTFRIQWRDAGQGQTLVTVRFDHRGRPSALELQGFDGEFERVDEGG